MTETVPLLYPLSLFRERDHLALPTAEAVAPEEMPEAARSLLVHHGDMTSRLEAFFGGKVVLEVLHKEHTAAAYRREVVLRTAQNGQAVEYGAIEINLAAFPEPVRRQIVEARLPLGGILNAAGVEYRSEPHAFVRLENDPVMHEIFADAPEVNFWFGRCNTLLDPRGETLARIVEVLRPV